VDVALSKLVITTCDGIVGPTGKKRKFDADEESNPSETAEQGSMETTMNAEKEEDTLKADGQSDTSRKAAQTNLRKIRHPRIDPNVSAEERKQIIAERRRATIALRAGGSQSDTQVESPNGSMNMKDSVPMTPEVSRDPSMADTEHYSVSKQAEPLSQPRDSRVGMAMPSVGRQMGDTFEIGTPQSFDIGPHVSTGSFGQVSQPADSVPAISPMTRPNADTRVFTPSRNDGNASDERIERMRVNSSQGGAVSLPVDVARDSALASSPHKTQMYVLPTGEVVGLDVAMQMANSQNASRYMQQAAAAVRSTPAGATPLTANHSTPAYPPQRQQMMGNTDATSQHMAYEMRRRYQEMQMHGRSQNGHVVRNEVEEDDLIGSQPVYSSGPQQTTMMKWILEEVRKKSANDNIWELKERKAEHNINSRYNQIKVSFQL
jgi:hypothetical protein